MRCKTCDYRLWNLRERRCPECGTPFLPSAFDFAPNSVQFCCPHCDQPYYGTGANGHLVPAAFNCVQCGHAVRMDEMVLRPTAGVEEEQTAVFRVPWLERRQRGFFKAWFGTIGAALVSPMRLMRGLPVGGPTGPARGFAALTLLAIGLVSTTPFLLIPLIAPMSLSQGLWAAAFSTAGAFAALAVFVILWALAAHGLLRLTGAVAGDRRRTFQAMYYSTGANVFTAIPCLGAYIGWIWWVVSAVLMVKEAQRVHGGRAAFAVLAPPLAIVGTLIGLYVWMIVSAFSALSAGALAPPPVQISVSPYEAQVVLDGLLGYARERDPAGPTHAAELVAEGYLDPDDFCGVATWSDSGSIYVQGTQLVVLGQMAPATAKGVAQQAAEALPTDIVAHRLGDFVFVHHGLDLTTADGDLWVVIGSPDPNEHSQHPALRASQQLAALQSLGYVSTQPAAPGAPNVPGVNVQYNWQVGPNTPLAMPPRVPSLVVGEVDGTVREIQAWAFPLELQRQNELRAEFDLPPLPDPNTVTHEQPAVSEPGGSQPAP